MVEKVMRKGYFVSSPKTGGLPTLLTEDESEALAYAERIKKEDGYTANYSPAWLHEENGREFWTPRV